MKKPTETKEEFLARYPKRSDKRVLVQCKCDYDGCTGWAWGWWEGVFSWETIAEPIPEGWEMIDYGFEKVYQPMKENADGR